MPGTVLRALYATLFLTPLWVVFSISCASWRLTYVQSPTRPCLILIVQFVHSEDLIGSRPFWALRQNTWCVLQSPVSEQVQSRCFSKPILFALGLILGVLKMRKCISKVPFVFASYFDLFSNLGSLFKDQRRN